MKKGIFLILFMLFLPFAASADTVEQSVEIERHIFIEIPNQTVFEKSSIMKATINGVKKEIRFVGVNTDRHAYSPCFREQSARKVQGYLKKNPVDLVSDPLLGNSLDNGSVSRYVRLPDGQILNELLIQEGHYFVNEDHVFEEKAYYKELENEARKNKRGIWGSKISCEIQSFIDFRRASQGEKFIYNISVYQILQFIFLALLLLVLTLILHFYSRGRKK